MPCCRYFVTKNAESVLATEISNGCQGTDYCPDINDPVVAAQVNVCNPLLNETAAQVLNKTAAQALAELPIGFVGYLLVECVSNTGCRWICTKEDDNLVWRIDSTRNCGGNPEQCYPYREGQPCYGEGDTCDGVCKDRKRCSNCIYENGQYFWDINAGGPKFLSVPCTAVNRGYLCETDQRNAYVSDCKTRSAVWKCINGGSSWAWTLISNECYLPQSENDINCVCPEPYEVCNSSRSNEIRRVSCYSKLPEAVSFREDVQCNYIYLQGIGWVAKGPRYSDYLPDLICDCNAGLQYIQAYGHPVLPISLPAICYSTATTGDPYDPSTQCVWQCYSGQWLLVESPTIPGLVCEEPSQDCINDGDEEVVLGQTTTTTAAPIYSTQKCIWRCNIYQEWELVQDCPVGFTCLDPLDDCTIDDLCYEVLRPCVKYQTTTTTTTTTSTPETTCGQTFCRWVCAYDKFSQEFAWVLRYSCPSGCTCVEPTGDCTEENVCATYAARCIPEYTTEEPTCGCCELLCLNGVFTLVSQDCIAGCYCAKVGQACYAENMIFTFACSAPVYVTTTTTTTTAAPTTTPSYPEGFCLYTCVDDVYVLQSYACESGYSCPDRIDAECTDDEIFIACSASGNVGYFVTSSGVVYLSGGSFSVQQITTVAPISITVNSGEVYLSAGELTISGATPEPEFELCPGDCFFVWDPNQELWLPYGSTCTCECYPPEGDGPSGEVTVRRGICGESKYASPAKEWTEPQWPSPVQPQVTTTTTPNCEYDSGEHPNGICLYQCIGGIYSRLCKNCILDKDCPDVYINESSPFCEDGEYLTLDCS